MKDLSWLLNAAVFTASVALALLAGAAAIAATGLPVLKIYITMFEGSLGSVRGFESSLVYAVPIAFTGLAAAVAFRAQVWNIGAEGQMVMGAFGAALAALYVPLPTWFMLPGVFIIGLLCGALWGLVTAVLKVWLGANEVLTSLMLNYVAILWVDSLVFGPWRDLAMGGWPYSAPFPAEALLPRFGNSGLNLALVVAMAAASLLFVLFRYTRWGFEISVIASSPPTARYAAMNIGRKTLQVMLLSGGVAGLAGVERVAGTAGRLFHMTPGYGYIGILVSWLAGHNPLLVLFMAAFYGVLLQGGATLRIAQVDPSLVLILQGAIILFALAGRTLTWRFSRRWQGPRSGARP